MKLFPLAAAALTLAGLSVPGAAEAQRWQSINQRQATQFARIDQGVRSGALTRAEAGRLRSEFRALDRLENRYRAGGLNPRERQDLNRRYDALSRRIYVQKRDRQYRR